MYRLAILVQGDATDFNDGLVRLGTRRRNFQDLAFHVQGVTGPRGFWPSQVAAQADNAIAQRQATIHKKAHGDCSGVPTAGCQSSKYAGFCGVFIQLERLRIKLSSEFFYSRFIHAMAARDESLAYVKVFQIQSLDAFFWLAHGSCLWKRFLSIGDNDDGNHLNPRWVEKSILPPTHPAR